MVDRSKAESYVGLSANEANRRAKLDGFEDVRICTIENGMIVNRIHLDKRVNRLNIHVENDIVIGFGFG